MFRRGPKGFSIWFAHAGVSVQFGPGNYCEHYDEAHYEEGYNPIPRELESVQAEIAICARHEKDRSKAMITSQWNAEAGYGVLGWVTADVVASAIAWAAAYNPERSDLAPALSEAVS